MTYVNFVLFYTTEQIYEQPGMLTLNLEIVDWQIKMRQSIKNMYVKLHVIHFRFDFPLKTLLRTIYLIMNRLINKQTMSSYIKYSCKIQILTPETSFMILISRISYQYLYKYFELLLDFDN